MCSAILCLNPVLLLVKSVATARFECIGDGIGAWPVNHERLLEFSLNAFPKAMYNAHI